MLIVEEERFERSSELYVPLCNLISTEGQVVALLTAERIDTGSPSIVHALENNTKVDKNAKEMICIFKLNFPNFYLL